MGVGNPGVECGVRKRGWVGKRELRKVCARWQKGDFVEKDLSDIETPLPPRR